MHIMEIGNLHGKNLDVYSLIYTAMHLLSSKRIGVLIGDYIFVKLVCTKSAQIIFSIVIKTVNLFSEDYKLMCYF